MYQLIVCGFDFDYTLEVIRREAEKAMEEGEELQSEFLNEGVFRKDSMTAHICRDRTVTGSYIRRGSADCILAATAADAVRNLEWLKPGGEITVNEKPGSSAFDEEYPASEMFRYITKTIL